MLHCRIRTRPRVLQSRLPPHPDPPSCIQHPGRSKGEVPRLRTFCYFMIRPVLHIKFYKLCQKPISYLCNAISLLRLWFHAAHDFNLYISTYISINKINEMKLFKTHIFIDFILPSTVYCCIQSKNYSILNIYPKHITLKSWAFGTVSSSEMTRKI